MKLSDLQALTASIPPLSEEQLKEWLQAHIRSLGLDPNMIYQELEMSSDHVDTHRDSNRSNEHINLHSHTFYELIYCCTSCNAEYLISSERYRLQAGDIIFIPPGVSHRPLLPEEMPTPYDRYVIWINPDFMNRYSSLFPYPFSRSQTGFGMLRTKGSKWEFLEEQFAHGVRESEQQADGWEAAVIGNTMMLLSNIKRAANDRSAPTMEAETPQLLDALTAYVEQHYADFISIDTAASRYFVSPSTVSHLFKQKLGVSFYRYVTQRRLIAAKSLIESGTPMEETALSTGFRDYSCFYRAFKKEYGISPKQYRTHFCVKQ